MSKRVPHNPLLSPLAKAVLKAATGEVLRKNRPGISLVGMEDSPVADLLNKLDELGSIASDVARAYGPTEGRADLRALVAESALTADSNVSMTDGASQALLLVLAAVAAKESAVLIPSPGFPGYSPILTFLGLKPRPYRWDQPEDCERLAALIRTGNSAALVLNSPHNPTGLTIKESEFLKIITLAARHRTFVILDDVYFWTSDPSGRLAHSSGDFPGLGNAFAAIFSMGKFLTLPGLRLGGVVCENRQILDFIVEMKRHTSQCSCPYAELISTRLFSHPSVILAKKSYLHELSQRRILMEKIILQTGGTCVEGGLGIYLYARQAELIRSRGIFGLPGVVFGDDDNTVRYCLAVSRRNWNKVVVEFTNELR